LNIILRYFHLNLIILKYKSVAKHRILIVEDNFLFAVKLEKNLVEWGHKVIGICETGQSAIDLLETETPTLILMDINLKGSLNGVETAKLIKYKEIPIVFTTGRTDEETFEDAKDTSGITYLVKPFDLLTLRGVIDFNPFLKLENQNESSNDFLFLRKNKELVKVKTSNISYIKSDRNYCDIFVGDKVYFLKISLTKLLEQLPPDTLVKIHRSYVVNLNQINSLILSENMIRIGDKKIPLGRKYKKDFLDKIKNYRVQ